MTKLSNISKQSKQVVVLYGTTALSVLIGVLNSVINTRSLIPEQYGDVRYVQNMISFISSLLLVGFFTSGSRLLALSKSELYSKGIRGAMVIILGITVLIITASMLFFYVFSIIKCQTNMSSLWLCSIAVCSGVLMSNYINTTAQGDNHIGRISIARLLPPLLYSMLAWLIYSNFGATPCLMLLLYNGLSVIILSFIIATTKPSFHNLRFFFKELFKENKTYGFNIYIGSLVGVSTGYIAGITLGLFCDNNASVGFYTLALTISTPLSMLPTIIGTTFYKRFATENCISKKVLISSFGLTAFSCLLFIAFIHIVVNLLYDESYRLVSIYAKWLAVGNSLHGLGDMINRFLGAHGQGRQIRNSAIGCGLTKTIGSFLFVYLWQIEGAVFSTILGSTIYFTFLLSYYLKYIKKQLL